MPKSRQILDMNAFDFERDSAQGANQELLTKRRNNFGASSVLFYERPVEMVSARGAWMLGADGQQYLDFYNNVPSVGHSHPKVVEAINRQLAQLNTNTRYLNSGVETYLERLRATFPHDDLNVVLACTGSEANDLAMRVAMKVTGAQGFVVSESAYHGNTYLVSQISPSAYKLGAPPSTIKMVPAPGEAAYGDDIGKGFASSVRKAISQLRKRKAGFAGFICDSIFSSDGVFADPPGFLAEAVDVVRQAGGLYIADEVQPGFGRTGGGLWGFLRHGVVPDIITMGKPMGNGFPMSGMATNRANLSAYCEDFGYFNTFGGNPVAAAAGNAVLDVIEQENLIEHSKRVGAYLLERLQDLQPKHEEMQAVRGAGLFMGIDLCEPGEPLRPDPLFATKAINHLKTKGVLIGAAGRYGHTLKVRPPLCILQDEADLFVRALDETLGQIRAARRRP